MPAIRRVIIIAEANGAGKTTFASEFLPQEAACPRFINADLIAAGLSPFDLSAAALRAGRLMLAEMRRCVAAGESFAFESTLAGRGYGRQIPRWQAAGYHVQLIFLKLRSVRLALARVKARVAAGGHHVPAATVRRRFRQGWINFQQLYRPLVDRWELYDNSEAHPMLLDRGERE
jgi:predicted ABC-type ATPase